MNKLKEHAKEILKERGQQYGDFGEMLQEMYSLKDHFRVQLHNIEDISTKGYRAKCFIYEMLCLKLTRGVILTRKLNDFALTNENLCDCAIDFINYCELLKTQYAFKISYLQLHTEADFAWFFERVVRLLALGEGKKETDNAV